MRNKQTPVRRMTTQRMLVLDAVVRLHDHATADEVYSLIVAEHPTVGRGTVYRNLGVLADEGRIRRISVPGGPDRFDHTVVSHCHAVCTGCRRVFDIDTAQVPDLTERITDSRGFEIDGFDVYFTGLCPDCKKNLQMREV